MRRPLRTTLPPLLAALLSWAAFCLLLLAAWLNILQLGRIYPGISLRFSSGITAQAAQSARQYAMENSSSTPFWPTFWKQETADFASSLKTQQAPCFFYDGDGQLVYPASFTSGSYPAWEDKNGCAVSSQLAYQLWGSTDVIGSTLTINGQPYSVRGVFTSTQPLALASPAAGAPVAQWQNAELSGTPTTDPAQAAKLFSTESGLGTPDSTVVGSQLTSLASVAVNLPLFVLAAAGIIFWLYKATKGHPFAKEAAFFLFLFAFALLLPRLLGALPPSIIPNKWSNFSHWEGLTKQISQQLKDWFLLVPNLKDAEAKFIILGQLFCVFGLFLLLPALLYTNFRGGNSPKPSPTKMELLSLPPGPNSHPEEEPFHTNPSQEEVKAISQHSTTE